MARTTALLSATDKVVITAATRYNNLPVTKFSVAWAGTIATGSAATTDNQALVTKSSSAFTGGWEFFLSLRSAAAGTYLHPRLFVMTSGGAATRFDRQSATPVVAGVPSYAGCSFDPTTGSSATNTRFFVGPLSTAVPETVNEDAEGYTNPASGTIGADATFDLWLANNVRTAGGYAPGGASSWFALFGGVALTLAQHRDVQGGLVLYQAGHDLVEAGSTVAGNALKTRAITILRAVSGHVMLARLDTASGAVASCLDYSVSSSGTVLGTITGTTASVAADELRYGKVPTLANVECDSERYAVPDARGTDPRFTYRSAGARSRWSTTATSVQVWTFRTTPLDSRYDGVANAGVREVISGTPGTWQKSPATALGFNSSSHTLSAGTKIVETRDAPRSAEVYNLTTGSDRPMTTTATVEVFVFDAEATEQAARTMPRTALLVADSLGEGFFLDPAIRYAPWWQLLDSGAVAPHYDDLLTFSAGGMAMWDIARDSTTRANFVSFIVALNPSVVLLELMVNDKGRAYWSAASYGAGFGALLDALLASSWTGKVVCTPGFLMSSANESSTNSFGDNLAAYRSAMATAASARSAARVKQLNLAQTSVLDPATDLYTDGVHFPLVGTTGANRVVSSGAYQTALFAALPDAVVTADLLPAAPPRATSTATVALGVAGPAAPLAVGTTSSAAAALSVAADAFPLPLRTSADLTAALLGRILDGSFPLPLTTRATAAVPLTASGLVIPVPLADSAAVAVRADVVALLAALTMRASATATIADPVPPPPAPTAFVGPLQATIARAASPIVARLLDQLGTPFSAFRAVETTAADNSVTLTWAPIAGITVAAPPRGIFASLDARTAAREWGVESEVTASQLVPLALDLQLGDTLRLEAGPLAGTTYRIAGRAPDAIAGVANLGLRTTRDVMP